MFRLVEYSSILKVPQAQTLVSSGVNDVYSNADHRLTRWIRRQMVIAAAILLYTFGTLNFEK